MSTFTQLRKQYLKTLGLYENSEISGFIISLEEISERYIELRGKENTELIRDAFEKLRAQEIVLGLIDEEVMKLTSEYSLAPWDNVRIKRSIYLILDSSEENDRNEKIVNFLNNVREECKKEEERINIIIERINSLLYPRNIFLLFFLLIVFWFKFF